MKFAHLSDCHIGGWHESSLRDINLKSFKKAVEMCIDEHVGFVLIAGDLFDNALPSIDILKETASILHSLKEYDIPVYVIPGSHDFSASGKTMLDVLENSGLLHNVMKFEDDKLKFTIDRTGVKIVGFYGKKGGLEVSEYEKLEKSHLENEPGFKIFMFHTLLNDLKPQKFEFVEGMSVNALPNCFDYYAGGHPHFVYNKEIEGYGTFAYPGPIFPNNFQELEELKFGGMYIVEADLKTKKLVLKHIKLNLIDVNSYNINAENKIPKDVEEEILNIKDFNGRIVTIRIEGCLKSGKTSDINFSLIKEKLSEAYFVLKNTNKLTTKDFKEMEVNNTEAVDVEDNIIIAHVKNSKYKEDFVKDLIKNLDKEKGEGEKNSDFELRIVKDLADLIKI